MNSYSKCHLKKITSLISILVAISGCIGSNNVQSSDNSISQKSENSSECSELPRGTLRTDDVKPIDLNNGLVKESGIARANGYSGYSFEAAKGQNFYMQTKDNICIWVYTPDNEIITDSTLPKDGVYTVQIAALQGTTTFNLELGLNAFEAVASESNSESPIPSNSGTSTAPELAPVNPVQPSVSTQRVQFRTGSTGAALQGTIAPNRIERYELWCKGGQYMSMSINGDINLVVYSPQGRAISNLSSHNTQWQGQLPSSGDYIIEISATRESTYSFEVSVL